MNLSTQLVHLRTVKGISQEELASLMNVTRQSVSKWETGQSFPDGEKIIRLSEVFDVSTDFLLKGAADPDLEQQSKASGDMSAEVTEILERVHNMSRRKRLSIGAGILAGAAVLIMLGLFLLKM